MEKELIYILIKKEKKRFTNLHGNREKCNFKIIIKLIFKSIVYDENLLELREEIIP